MLDAERICGVGYFGRQVVIAAEPDAVVELARVGATRRGERMIVGPRAQIRAYWDLVGPSHVPPHCVRERQLLLAIERGAVRGTDAGVRVRPAHSGDVAIVAQNSAQMILGELGYDPRKVHGDFTAGVAQMIDREACWVGESGAELCFFCNIGPVTPRTAQLQGIWTPEHLRARGLATAALANICEALLADVPTLSLYVNDFNDAAIRLYDRVGFTAVGEFQTLLF